MSWDPLKDGVEHVNVYSRAATQLGRLLSNFAHTPFNHPEHGRFASVEGLWYWYSARDERLRGAHGFDAKQLGRLLRGKDWVQTPEFQETIKVAIRAKLDAHPFIVAGLLATKLPLAHYYMFGNRVTDETARCRWMLNVYDEVRP